MTKERYPDSGALFPTREKKMDRSPDYTGNCTLDCPHCKGKIDMRIAGWKKPGRQVKMWLSLAFSLDEKEKENDDQPQQQGRVNIDEDVDF